MGGEPPTKIDQQKKVGTLILSSPLEGPSVGAWRSSFAVFAFALGGFGAVVWRGLCFFFFFFFFFLCGFVSGLFFLMFVFLLFFMGGTVPDVKRVSPSGP